jgi:hypothetical protein
MHFGASLSDLLESSGRCRFQDRQWPFAGLRRLRFSFFSDEPTQTIASPEHPFARNAFWAWVERDRSGLKLGL